MKKIALAVAAASLALSGAASAADLAARPYTKAPPPMVAVYNWTGFYVGANAGGGWSHKCWDLTNFAGVPVNPNLAEGCHDASGATVGGQVGYRWQANQWVFGLEAQGNWADFKGSNASLILPGTVFNVTNQTKIDSFGLFTGQIGYAWNNVLLYVKGGAAVASDKYQGNFTTGGLLLDTAKETRWGAVVGAGIEFGFAPNWSVGFDYAHAFMDSRDINFNAAPPLVGVTRTERVRQDLDIATVRLNYRFGGPIVARY